MHGNVTNMKGYRKQQQVRIEIRVVNCGCVSMNVNDSGSSYYNK